VEDNDLIAKLNADLKQVSGEENLWLGITDEAEEGKFIGTDGSKINWFNWHTNEPDNRNGAGNSQGGKGYFQSIFYICVT